jgi:hypothetical protein
LYRPINADDEELLLAFAPDICFFLRPKYIKSQLSSESAKQWRKQWIIQTSLRADATPGAQRRRNPMEGLFNHARVPTPSSPASPFAVHKDHQTRQFYLQGGHRPPRQFDR